MNELRGMSCQNKCSEPFSFYRFYVKPSSRYSLVHILSTSSSTNDLRFLLFLYEIELSLQPHAHFVGRILKKWPDVLSFVLHFFVKESSRYSLVHTLSTSSSKSGLKVSVFDFCVARVSNTLCRPHLPKVV